MLLIDAFDIQEGQLLDSFSPARFDSHVVINHWTYHIVDNVPCVMDGLAPDPGIYLDSVFVQVEGS